MGDLRLDPAFSDLSQEAVDLLCLHNELASVDLRIFFKDRQSRFVCVSLGWVAAYAQRQSAEHALGKTDADFFSAQHASDALADERTVMATGEPMRAKLERETFVDRPDAWGQTTKLPLRDADGKIVGTWGFTRDVTEQIAAEQALALSRERSAASERMHRAMFENNPQPMWLYDRASFQIVAVNDAAIVAYGYSRSEFLVMRIPDLLPAEDVAEWERSMIVRDGEQTGSRVSMPCRHRYRDGTVRDVEITANDVLLDGQACRIVLSQDVTARNRAATELAFARDEAVEASNTKSAFLANISHEIRTPMNGVLGLTELLLDSKLDADQRSLAQQLAASGELMVALINDILDISKIEAGQLQLEIGDFSMRESIERACAMVAPQAAAQDVELIAEIDAALPHHQEGDGRRFHQILLNLIGNAVKFTSEGKIVVRARVVRAGSRKRAARVEVIDTGIGVEQRVLQDMFEPFTQADSSTTRNYGGSGLGLAISRELIELMGGAIGATSAAGVGSTFWVELPLRESTRARERSPRQVTFEDGVKLPLWSTAPLVLVVEDSPVNRIVAVRMLERCGCRTDVAENGRSALEMLRERDYDAILMDCQMPGMDGYEATALLRASENGGPRMPVIAMTAHAMHGDRERCLAAGMDDYVSKPIRRGSLVEALRRWLPGLIDGEPAAPPNGRPRHSAQAAGPAR
ncbi:MAG: response regulator [Solirubrobacteraceae bacterium]|jgi:PAS domain S-box-containing protein